MEQSIGLGVYQLKDDDIYKVVPIALKLGYRYFDTAIRYGNQEILAKVLKEELIKQNIPRNQVFIVSKLGHRCMGNLPKRIKKIIKENPKRENEYTSQDLKLDLEKDWMKIVNEVICHLEYIDLILLHRPYHKVINKEMWGQLIEIKRKNPELIHKIGVSNFRKNELIDIMPIMIPAYNQFEISPFSPREELRYFCQENNIKIIGHSSLAKMKFNLNEYPFLEILSQKYNVSVATILLKWSLEQNIQIIPRTSCLEHLKENYIVQKLNFKFSEDDYLGFKKIINGFLTHQEYQD